jgi:hypothetical protein
LFTKYKAPCGIVKGRREEYTPNLPQDGGQRTKRDRDTEILLTRDTAFYRENFFAPDSSRVNKMREKGKKLSGSTRNKILYTLK